MIEINPMMVQWVSVNTVRFTSEAGEVAFKRLELSKTSSRVGHGMDHLTSTGVSKSPGFKETAGPLGKKHGLISNGT